MDVLKNSDVRTLNVEGLAARCGVKRKDLHDFEAVVFGMENRGVLVKKGSRRFSLATDEDYVVGRFKQQRNGDGVVVPEDETQADIFIPSGSQGSAFLHDIVRVRVRQGRGPGDRGRNESELRGTVVEVLKRAFAEVVGTFEDDGSQSFCLPDDPRFPPEVRISSTKANLDPSQGDKIVVQIDDYGDGRHSPSGRLVSVLGPPDGKGVDMAGIIRQYSLPQKFPRKVLQEARALPEFLTERDYAGRVDCRDDLVITIDPDDARDFDDAISVKREKSGDYRVWVHIADVSHFVRPGSALDEEARERGNSTYLVDRVIPMLPESLSNGLCSLQPNVDRLTKCAEVMLSPQGEVLSYKLYSAVIHSRRRYTYEEAMDVIDGSGKAAPDRMIRVAWEIAFQLRRRRIHDGALDLDFPDRKIRLDSQGRVREIEMLENDESHQLIEEFMLLANECVAKELRKRKVPSVFRVHEDPAKERLRELEMQMKRSHIHVSALHRQGNLNKLVAKIKKHQAASALSVAVLRSMKRARYSTKPLGHFGLAKRDYTHFTSPIRRYADLVVHRSVFEKVKLDAAAMSKMADHISSTERNSADAEYDSRIVKIQRYLEDVRNDPVRGRFQAVVTEVRPKGLMVDLPELGINGLVPIRALGTDSYRFFRDTSTISARKSGQKFSIGSSLPVSVLRIDKANRFFDFTAASVPRSRSGKSSKSHPTRQEKSDNPISSSPSKPKADTRKKSPARQKSEATSRKSSSKPTSKKTTRKAAKKASAGSRPKQKSRNKS